ncbi:SET domain-containing protein SmydA-8-like [Folsomia candida]|uniref:SET domain-containing protein SmydA-8-like n=1 Tax=Folsomia candida TaxID=158441 RepID=UPI00160539E6|nr:SET domain-containing protein SmydA-8-like [Folsomia candida]XP_035716178.1 SET domain-containing protein SmydA-8-like [Folsomia candida]
MSSFSLGHKTCQVCRIQCNSSCTNCRKVSYCSRAHQKKDWKSHKSDCFPWVISEHKLFGRYLTASRPITGGELILKENAIFSGPGGFGELKLCLICYGLIDDEYCAKCGWPVHAKCEKSSSVHAENECPIFQRNRILLSCREDNIYEKMLVLRGCLIKLRDPFKWSLLVQLESHKDARFENAGALISRKNCDFILKRCALSPQLTEAEVDHILGVIIVNAYVTEDNVSTSPDFQVGCFVFSKGSMPAHSCLPNCKWTIIQGVLNLRALTDIPKGESLTHCYSYGGCGTLERQKHLLTSKFFLCGCPRCLDPTEMGSYFSAIKCPCGGNIVSMDTTKLDASWGCTRSNCQYKTNMTPDDVTRLIETLRAAHKSAIGAGIEQSTDLEWRATLRRLESHVTPLSGKVHPNHFLLHEVEQDILCRISCFLGDAESY